MGYYGNFRKLYVMYNFILHPCRLTRCLSHGDVEQVCLLPRKGVARIDSVVIS